MQCFGETRELVMALWLKLAQLDIDNSPTASAGGIAMDNDKAGQAHRHDTSHGLALSTFDRAFSKSTRCLAKF
ncbi:hypothetical protein J1614_011689 [Plenodomus biglobosus]|nr:hypothetical protein J1614_011689 [Plenodomus biglobosus]